MGTARNTCSANAPQRAARDIHASGAALLLVLVAACSTPTAASHDARVDPDLQPRPDMVAKLEPALRLATQLLPSESPGVRLLATGHDRLAAFHVEREGDVFCPDCNALSPEACPQACVRDQLMRTMLDHAGSVVAPPESLVTFFPPTPDHALEAGARRVDDSGRVELLYYTCDNTPCSVGIASRRCSALLARFDPSGARVGPDRALYADRWGDVALHANGQTRELLLLYAPPAWGSVGATQVMVLDAQREVVRAWTALGSDQRLSEAAAADGDGFVVVISDREPGGAATTRCETSCDCVHIVATLPSETGLFAYQVSAAGMTQPVAIEDGKALAAPMLRRAGEGLMLVGRVGEVLHAYHLATDSDRWRQLPPLVAPSSDQWLLALDAVGQPTKGQLLIVGGDVRDDLAQQLVVSRVDAAGATERILVGDFQPAYYFDFTHTLWRGDDGSARIFIQRAIWPPPGADDWARWEILRLDIVPR